MQRSLGQKSEGPRNIHTPTGVTSARKKSRPLAELRRHQTRVILTADKGVALVVLDKDDYITKVQDLLKDAKT